MFGEIYLIVIFAVGAVTYFHFAPNICMDDDMDDLNVPIYK